MRQGRGIGYAGSGTPYNPASVAITGGTISGVTSVSSALFRFPSSTQITAPSDGLMLLTDTAGTAFNRLQFGGTTSSYPALKRSNANLEVRLADDSGYSQFSSAAINILPGTALTAGGSTSMKVVFSSSFMGVYAGSGAPTLSAPQGSIYLRSDGSSTSTRLYVNTNGTTGWTNVTTAT